MWNVILYSVTTDERMLPLRSLDGRPLRFTEKRYAERTAHEKNSNAQFYEEGLRWMVVEDNGNYGYGGSNG